ncbi:MAG: hypothetical protein ABW012_04805 [Gaiellaceae bacterium]
MRKPGSSNGRVERATSCGGAPTTRPPSGRRVEWVVEAPTGTKVGVVARHDRKGTVRAELVL